MPLPMPFSPSRPIQMSKAPKDPDMHGSSTAAIGAPVRTDSGAVILPLPWSIAPGLAPRLALPEVALFPKDELHLTLLSSADADRLDSATGGRDAWRALLGEGDPDAWRVTLGDAWWLLRADKAEGPAWSVIALADCPAFTRLRARAAGISHGAIAPDAPAHVTLYVAGDRRGIGLPSGAEFERCRVRRLRARARMSPE
jgi:hypothetical protein